MGIQDEIYQDFLKKLKKDRNVPKIIVQKLELQWNQKKKYNKSFLFKIIKEGVISDNKNK